MHYKLFRVITLSARDITLKSDKDGKVARISHNCNTLGRNFTATEVCTLAGALCILLTFVLLLVLFVKNLYLLSCICITCNYFLIFTS